MASQNRRVAIVPDQRLSRWANGKPHSIGLYFAQGTITNEHCAIYVLKELAGKA